MDPMAGLRGTALVTQGGSVMAELAGGPADIETGVPCTPATRFQLCSISKQFTAAAVMLLAESGQLHVHEPVTRWLPEAPPQWRQVTLHHLLSHTAGVPHWHEAPGLDPAEPATISERLTTILATPLRTEPGGRWHYSSPGFLLNGLIAERASGQPYREFVAERILLPLKLTQTTIGSTSGPAARGYRDGHPAPSWDLAAMPGTGDLWSTAGDLSRFTTALYSGELVTADSLRLMCRAHAALDDEEEEGEPRLATTGYGYGIFTGTIAGHTAWYHPGDNPGYQSFACWIPDEAASIVILLNDETASLPGLLKQLLAAALEPPGAQASK
jgi:CubicO group peptidase (beta-lactamase class C family)